MFGPESSEQYLVGQPSHMLVQQLRSRQRFWAAAVSGVTAGLIGGFIWGAVTGISGLHVEFVWLPMIGIGYLVGKAIAFFGRGIDLRFAWLGATIAALASIAGYPFTVVIAVAWQLQLGGNFFLIEHGSLDTTSRLLVASLGWADGVCLGFSVYEGFRFSRLPIEESSLQGVRPAWSPTLVIILLSVFPAVVGLTWLSVGRKTIKAIANADQGRLGVLKTTLDGSGEVEIWDVPNRRLVANVGRESPRIRAMSMTSGQSTLATVTRRTEDQAPVGKGLRSYGVIGIWDAATGKLKEELARQASAAAKVLLTPDGAHLLVKEEGGLVKIWTLEDEQEALLAHDADVSCMALDAGGQVFVTAAGNRLHIYNLVEMKKRGVISLDAGPIGDVALSPDGTLVAVVLPLGQRVKVFDTSGQKEVATLVSGQDWLTAASFSLDGKTLAVGGGSFRQAGKVELWDLAVKRKTRELKVNTNTVRCLSFSADGKELIAGSTQSCRLTHAFRQGDVHRWNASTGEALPSLGR